MMDVFGNPDSLLEAVKRVISFDDYPLVLIAGFSRPIVNEVYVGYPYQFETSSVDAERIHSLLEIPKPKSSRVAYSLSLYGGSGSKDINHHMWKNYLHGSIIPDDIKSHIDNISSVLIPSTNIDHVKLYTGVKTSPATTAGVKWNSTRPIKMMHLPAFTSTSTNFDVAHSFTEPDYTTHHYESDHHGIILPNARHIIELNFNGSIPHAASLINHVGSSTEEEVLLGPNHRFELHPRPTKLNTADGVTYIWKAVSRGIDNTPMFKQRDFTK